MKLFTVSKIAKGADVAALLATKQSALEQYTRANAEGKCEEALKHGQLYYATIHKLEQLSGLSPVLMEDARTFAAAAAKEMVGAGNQLVAVDRAVADHVLDVGRLVDQKAVKAADGSSWSVQAFKVGPRTFIQHQVPNEPNSMYEVVPQNSDDSRTT